MTQDIKHTPLPYKQCKSTPSLIEDTEGNIFIKVSEIYNGRDDDEERTDKMWANAEFIVRACNNHYQLIEALNKCSELFSTIRGDWTDPRSECCEGWRVISEAIAKAEGR